MRSVTKTGLIYACAILLLAGCSSWRGEAKYPTGADRADLPTSNDIYAKPDSIFGKGGISGLFGKNKDGSDEAGIGVNSYLWRAALDTVSFMPLASADPFGGVILTDWYSPPENADERLKLNVFILDKQLKSDAVQVKIYRQEMKKGGWRDVEVEESVGRSIEDAILTRARAMRVSAMSKQ